MPKTEPNQLFVCVKNDGYEASLETRKIYVALPDTESRRRKLLRIVDESGEDYLYPESLFRPVELPQTVRRAVLAA